MKHALLAHAARTRDRRSASAVRIADRSSSARSARCAAAGARASLDTVASVALAGRRRLLSRARPGAREAPAAVARAPQADHLLHLHRLHPGHPDHRVLPAGRAAAVLELQLVPGQTRFRSLDASARRRSPRRRRWKSSAPAAATWRRILDAAQAAVARGIAGASLAVVPMDRAVRRRRTRRRAGRTGGTRADAWRARGRMSNRRPSCRLDQLRRLQRLLAYERPSDDAVAARR